MCPKGSIISAKDFRSIPLEICENLDNLMHHFYTFWKNNKHILLPLSSQFQQHCTWHTQHKTRGNSASLQCLHVNKVQLYCSNGTLMCHHISFFWIFSFQQHITSIQLSLHTKNNVTFTEGFGCISIMWEITVFK